VILAEHDMRSFDAKAVAAVELPDLNTFAVVLAEEPDGTGDRVEITKPLSFDEQDRVLGMDTYCLYTEQGTCYGGVASWTLSGHSLDLRLNPHAARELGVEGGFLVNFAPEHLQTLREGLERVFG
jgi:hypothetical protein